ncbi:hypothetical protein [Mycolicibacterium iranicum]|uniref:Uncharacterized protein n=1 Tax=Mycolicibacterium iranicum TaxID=912594 RepID=A0ABT4HNU5_MYCIR|nr:hypothetical protein [Mycolicibacterium iranicum]MCZ0731860.1 hypothetical protein [Mycolicibacterium iranicum]
MTAEQHIDAMNLPNPAVGSMVDQREAMNLVIDRFMADYVRNTGNFHHLLLSPIIKEIRHARYRLAEATRRTFASDIEESEMLGGQYISDATAVTGLIGHTVDPRGSDGLPVNVPIAVYRDGTELTRVFCWGEVTLESVFAGLTQPRYVMDMSRSDFGKRLPDPGCDLQILPESLHNMTQSNLATNIWPMPAGDCVYFLRYCNGCYGALVERHGIGKCGIWNPETEGIG